jgi:hypothetical protein
MTGYRRRIDPPLSEAFRKDARQEDFLERLNLILRPHAEAEQEPDPEEVHPTLHVVGAPRSGTTLMYQVVASGLDVGYVNNLSAAFWLAPAYGVMLARALGVDRLQSSFASTFGRTQGVGEPHEFGYFWNHFLGYPDLAERGPDHEASIDWARLRRTLITMARDNGGPMAFKPMLLIWHLEEMLRHMPRTCYVWIRREPRDTALSLLKMRQSLYGTLDRWASLRPAVDLSGEPPWRQVAAQVVLLERHLEAVHARLGDRHMLAVRYERLCADPVGVLSDVRDMMGAKGHTPEILTPDLAPFTQMRNEALAGEYGDRVDAAITEFTDRFAG